MVVCSVLRSFVLLIAGAVPAVAAVAVAVVGCRHAALGAATAARGGRGDADGGDCGGKLGLVFTPRLSAAVPRCSTFRSSRPNRLIRFGLFVPLPPLHIPNKRRPVPTQHFEHGGRDTIRSVRSLAYAFSPAALRILSLLSNQFRARLGTPCDRGGGSGEKAAVEGYILVGRPTVGNDRKDTLPAVPSSIATRASYVVVLSTQRRFAVAAIVARGTKATFAAPPLSRRRFFTRSFVYSRSWASGGTMADVTAAAGLLRCGETCESELGAFIMYGLVVSTLHHPIP